MPKGRMLNKKISQDEKVARLSIEAALLYTWCIPYLDVKGRMYGDVWTLKSIVPHVQKVTPNNIPSIIQEWVTCDLVTYYGDDVHKYIEFKGFSKNQKLREDREADSEIPNPDKLMSDVGLTPAQVKLSKDKISKEKIREITHPPFISISQEEEKELVSNYGKSVIKDYIERINDYIGSSGKKYKSHYHTIKNWLRRDNIKKVDKPKEEAPKEELRYDPHVSKLISETAKKLKGVNA